MKEIDLGSFLSCNVLVRFGDQGYTHKMGLEVFGGLFPFSRGIGIRLV